MVWKVTVVPNKTMDNSNSLLSANLVPELKIGCLKKVFPKRIPKRMAMVAAPMVGNQMAMILLMAATIKAKPKPGKFFLMVCIIYFTLSVLDKKSITLFFTFEKYIVRILTIRKLNSR